MRVRDAHHDDPREAGRLSLERVIETAVAVLDEDGLGAVTTRRVAAELGTGQASLYAYVRTKDDLLAHVMDRVLAQIPLPNARGTWQQRLMRYGRQTRKGLLERPGASGVALVIPPSGPAYVRRVEWLLSLLSGAGVPGRVAVAAVDSINLFILTSVHDEELCQETGDDMHWARRVGVDDDLPEETYPHAMRLAPMSLSGSGLERFETALRLMVTGLEEYAAPS